jgi:hypothetical protein
MNMFKLWGGVYPSARKNIAQTEYVSEAIIFLDFGTGLCKLWASKNLC